jgi:predicted transglutaminase-like cysteine proteinase
VRKSSFVIAETIPGSYDGVGRQVTSSFFHRKAPHAALPIGRYIGQPLTFKCQSIADVRRFLAACKAVSAQDLFGKRDYWQPPEEFERLKKGGCVDFSLWTWRQLLSLGYDARFVGGASGR